LQVDALLGLAKVTPCAVMAHSLRLYFSGIAGILSLKADQTVTMLSETGNGWSLLRADGGEEGWFPSGYTQEVRKFVEIEDEQGKVHPLLFASATPAWIPRYCFCHK